MKGAAGGSCAQASNTSLTLEGHDSGDGSASDQTTLRPGRYDRYTLGLGIGFTRNPKNRVLPDFLRKPENPIPDFSEKPDTRKPENPTLKPEDTKTSDNLLRSALVRLGSCHNLFGCIAYE